jgi:hypothetical protein
MANIRRGELVTDQETAARIAKIRAHAEYWSTTAQGSEEADDALWLLAQLQAAQARAAQARIEELENILGIPYTKLFNRLCAMERRAEAAETQIAELTQEQLSHRLAGLLHDAELR